MEREAMSKVKSKIKSKAKSPPKSKSKSTILSEAKSRKGRSAVKKGKQYEREVANLLGHIFPDAARHLEYQAFEASHGVDLQGTDIFKFQIKNYQGYASISKIFEVKQIKEGDIPVLVTKGNRLPAMAVLPLENFVEMLEVFYGIECQRSMPKSLADRQERKVKLIEAIETTSQKVLSVDDLI